MNWKLKLKNFNWPAGSFIIGYHLLLLITLPLYLLLRGMPERGLIITTLIVLATTEIGIGAAYHRHYAHRGYKLRKPAEAVLLFFATLALQSSALRWSHDHRIHHAFVDKDEDPYCIKKGFWYAHILWIFNKPKPMDPKYVPDLLANKLVMWQDKYYNVLGLGSNVLLVLVTGFLTGDYIGAFIFVWLLRLFISHHVTWFVNSLAHSWGERTYSREQSAVDNYALAFFTFGEGYHNYHHVFPPDYRNGHQWYHFDPNKWVIWILSKLGLAYDLQRFNYFRIQKQLLIKDRIVLLERIRRGAEVKKHELESKISLYAQELYAKYDRITALLEQRKMMKKNRAPKESRASIVQEFKSLKHEIRKDWKEWCRLCKLVMQGQIQNY